MMYAAFDEGMCDQRSVGSAIRPPPYSVVRSVACPSGLIVACPHSGRYYPEEMLTASQLDSFTLRRSEDAFVDLLVSGAPTHGATLIVNHFARAFVDVNRCNSELDPLLIDEVPFISGGKLSERVKAGLGVIPRSVGDGLNIYRAPLARGAAQDRIAEVHAPWHQAIEDQMSVAKRVCGIAVLLDCHSMPSAASGDPSVDIVIGDRFGSSCAPILTNEAISFLRQQGLVVGRNDPYAGGYATIRHSNIPTGHHSLQIEINRSLYMVEGAMTRRAGFDELAKAMSGLVARLGEVTQSLVVPRRSRV
jgi:N-formylglutamate amidohydrolase